MYESSKQVTVSSKNGNKNFEFWPPRRLLAIKRRRSVSTQDKLSSTCQEDQSAAKMSQTT
jgi:hypothetical protein